MIIKFAINIKKNLSDKNAIQLSIGKPILDIY